MPRTNNGATIVVFAKAPQPGRVKTRLVPLLGAEGAASLHARLIERTLATARASKPGALELHGAPADNDFLRRCADRYGVELVEQSSGDLGERMRAAVERALRAASCAIVIGTDCPALTPDHLRGAALALEGGNDAVLTPVEDGGYALIGLKRCDARLFEGIDWGTDTVAAATRTRLAALRWRWSELEILWDVDWPADYQRLVASGLLNAADLHWNNAEAPLSEQFPLKTGV
jgi:rSAM/selenodomain-associated transferase 1